MPTEIVDLTDPSRDQLPPPLPMSAADVQHETKARLARAIQNASQARLRQMLQEFVAADKHVMELVKGKLLVEEDQVRELGTDESSSDEDEDEDEDEKWEDRPPFTPAKEIPPIPVDLLEQITKFDEPDRSSHWLRSCFEEDPESNITQIELWQAYRACFTEFSTAQNRLSPADFVKNVSATFSTANAQVIPGPYPKFIIVGIRPRYVPIDFKGKPYSGYLWKPPGQPKARGEFLPRLCIPDERERELNKSVATDCALTSRKRMRSRYSVCEQCDEEFDVTDNHMGDCVWHSGRTVGPARISGRRGNLLNVRCLQASWRSIGTAAFGMITTRCAMDQSIPTTREKSTLRVLFGIAVRRMGRTKDVSLVGTKQGKK
ncbi:Chromatin structure-remodeling complex protein rsc9 [Loxospora ochrophaea]|nr:Chromatin structure-remodeling complex protein rsc9 [Loxospora ochrophaea]